MRTPYACPRGLVPMPRMDTLAESGLPGTSGCLGMLAVIAEVAQRLSCSLTRVWLRNKACRDVTMAQIPGECRTLSRGPSTAGYGMRE